MEKKIISVFSPGLSGGGAERVASIITNELYMRGYYVYFVAAFSPQREYALNDGVKYKYIGIFNKLGVVSRFLRKLIVLFHMYRTKSDISISFIISDQDFAFRSKKYKKIVSLRNDPKHMMHSAYMRRIMSSVFFNADHVVFQTEEAKSFFTGKIKDKGLVIFNPISSNLPFWRDYEHEKIIMTACRLEEQKNLPLLINAFAEFLITHTEYSLHIFGEGPLKEKLERLIKELGLEGKAILKGRTKEIFKEYCRSEMFVLSSDYEGMSNSMIEALAIGIPTICTDCPIGGAHAMIHNMENGILTTVGCKKELVDALIRVADDEKIRMRFSEAADITREKLSVKTIVDQWEKIINE